MTWIDRVAENIFPLSEEQDDLCTAMKEWEYTGVSIDRGEEDDGEEEVDCEMCNHHDLRYHFKIRNTITCRDLWVGSKCVLRYKEEVRNIPQLIADNKTLIDTAKKKREADRAEAARIAHEAEAARISAENMRCNRVIEQNLVAVWKADVKSRDYIKSLMEFYMMRRYFTPRQVLSLIPKFNRYRITVDCKCWARIIGCSKYHAQCMDIVANSNSDLASSIFIEEYVTRVNGRFVPGDLSDFDGS